MKKYMVTAAIALVVAMGFYAARVVDAQYTPASSEMLAAGVSTDIKTSGDMTTSGDFVCTPEVLTISTNAYTLTPTCSYVVLDPAAVTTVTVANATAAGQMLTIVNKIATNAVIADGSNIQGTGAITLGQWDSVTFIAEMSATNWVQTSTSNN